MYPRRQGDRPLATHSREEKEHYKTTREDGGPNDDFQTKIHYQDGSTTVYWGGPCGSSQYDEFGEEC